MEEAKSQTAWTKLSVSASDNRGHSRRARRVAAPVAPFQPNSGAMSLAASLGSEVLVVHVPEFHSGLGLPLQTAEEVESLVSAAMFEVQLNGASATSAITLSSLNGVASQIVDVSTEWGADLIVVGSRRHRGIRRLMGRGVRGELLRRCNLPIVVAPAEMQSQTRS